MNASQRVEWNWRNKRFEIPDATHLDWDGAVRGSTPPERELIELQRYGMNLLDELAERPVSTPSLGWLSLWVKGFSLLDAARGALSRGSAVGLRTLARTAFETELHALLITEAGLEYALERLSAYVAWSAWNDYNKWKSLAYPANLIAAYNPRTERDLAAELGAAREGWEKIFGPVEILSDQEAERDLREATAAANKRVAELEAFLDQAPLRAWVQKLRNLSPRGEWIFFGSLFSDSVTTVSQKMRELRIKHAYAACYGDGSLAVHSASFEQTLLLQPSATDVVPRFVATDDEAARLCETIAAWSKRILVRLQLILALLPTA